MSYFTKDFNQFFKELAANNHKDWFDENRERYHKVIKEPFENFVAALIDELKEQEPALSKADPKKCIFRINRDIRFAKDKAPYKLNRAAVISPFGRKDRSRIGLYIQLGPENVRIAGGAYGLDKDQLDALRQYIEKNKKAFREALNDPQFKDTYGEIQGEENKRLPNKELTEAAKKEPLLYKKQFFYSAAYPPEMVMDDNLIEFISEKYRDARPVREFLQKPLK